MDKIPGQKAKHEEEGNAVMADSEKKSLVWSIKKGLLILTTDELFQLANSIGTVPGKELSKLQVDEEESCFEDIQAFMCSAMLLESEDSGMAQLLELNDMTDNVIRSRVVPSKAGAGGGVGVLDSLSNPVQKVSMRAGQLNANADSMATSAPNANTIHTTAVSRIDPLLAIILNTPSPTTGVRIMLNTDVDLRNMLSSYDELSNKALQHINNPTSPTFTPSPAQPIPPSNQAHSISVPERHAYGTYDRAVPLQDLPLLRQ